jgi:hypothetical protein
VNQAPNPADRRPDEALFKIPPDQLKEQTATVNQISQE